jgi:hypothetical protein
VLRACRRLLRPGGRIGFYTAELARLEPPGAFAQRQADRRRMLAAIHAGLLRRVLLLARTYEGRRRRGDRRDRARA